LEAEKFKRFQGLENGGDSARGVGVVIAAAVWMVENFALEGLPCA